jgi:antitoxin HicB
VFVAFFDYIFVIKEDTMNYRAAIHRAKRSTDETLTFPDFPIELVSAGSREDLLNAAREALLDVVQEMITARTIVPLPSEPQENEVLLTIPASAALTIHLSNAMLEKRIAPSELARLINITRQEAHRMTNLRHPTKVDRIQDALAAMGVELKIAASRIRSIPVYKTKDGTPTFRRYQLLENGTAENNRKVRDIRPRSDEELALVLNQGTGAQELMLVGKGAKRTAAECCFEQD